MPGSSTALLNVLLDVFGWIGLGGALILGALAVALWAADGTWLPADAIVDREAAGTVVRWFDADGDANSAVASPAEAAELSGCDEASIWYRHGWQGRMRLTRRPRSLRAVLPSAAAMAALWIACVAAGWVLYFLHG